MPLAADLFPGRVVEDFELLNNQSAFGTVFEHDVLSVCLVLLVLPALIVLSASLRQLVGLIERVADFRFPGTWLGFGFGLGFGLGLRLGQG